MVLVTIFLKKLEIFWMKLIRDFQATKEIILMDRTTGDLFQGSAAREMLSLPMDATIRIKPSNLEKYVVFVQSTSANRKLIGKTRFLYEVEDWDH